MTEEWRLACPRCAAELRLRPRPRPGVGLACLCCGHAVDPAEAVLAAGDDWHSPSDPLPPPPPPSPGDSDSLVEATEIPARDAAPARDWSRPARAAPAAASPAPSDDWDVILDDAEMAPPTKAAPIGSAPPPPNGWWSRLRGFLGRPAR